MAIRLWLGSGCWKKQTEKRSTHSRPPALLRGIVFWHFAWQWHVAVAAGILGDVVDGNNISSTEWWCGTKGKKLNKPNAKPRYHELKQIFRFFRVSR
jgi:hypothetical protein